MSDINDNGLTLGLAVIGRLMASVRGPVNLLGKLPTTGGAGPACDLMCNVAKTAKAFSDAIEAAYAFEEPRVSLDDIRSLIAKAGDAPGGGL